MLPFINMSGDPEQEYFSDGISEDIITALSKLRWFFVIARNSSFIYKGKAVHLRQVAADLGVGYVVEGSVRKSGDRVRITVQLNDVATGGHIWAERYDRGLADVFAVQDEITEAIVAAIEPQLYARESFRAQRKAPDSMDAWDLVMRGLSHYWRVTRQDNIVAQALLEKAIAIDPNYGQALGVLATSHTFSAHMGWADRATTLPIAKRAALAAIRADSEDPWAHQALGCVYLFTRRFDNSLAEFEVALALNPNFSLAQAYYGLALSYCARLEEAERAVRRALRLSPRDPFSAIYMGIAAYWQFVGRNYREAMRLAHEAIRQRSDFVGGHRVLTAAAGMAGDTEAAAAALRELRRAQPQYLARLDRGRDADHAGWRTRALSGSLPPRGIGLAAARTPTRPNVLSWVRCFLKPLGSRIHGQRPALAAALFCPPPCAPVRDRALPAPLPRPPSGAGEVDPTFFVAAGERGGPDLTRPRHLFRGVAFPGGILDGKKPILARRVAQIAVLAENWPNGGWVLSLCETRIF